METRTQLSGRVPSHPIYVNEGMSLRKTVLIIVTVIGCIAILWPKVFYPMIFAPGPAPNQNYDKLQRGPGGLRQERPAHLHPESIYQAMRERGRAIPATQTVPIVDRKNNPPPRIVEGRPGPIPGMRPPMGAGSIHQPQQKGSSMGILMPVYTIGIILFFGYTLVKILFKRSVPNAPYGAAPADPKFRKDVFEQGSTSQVEDLRGSKLGEKSEFGNKRNQEQELYKASLAATSVASNLSTSVKQHQQLYHQPQSHLHYTNGNAKEELNLDSKQSSQGTKYDQQDTVDGSGGGSRNELVFNKETQQLMEIEKLRKKLEDTERAMAKLIAEMNSDQYEAKKSNENSTIKNLDNISNGHTNIMGHEQAEIKKDATQQQQLRKRREPSAEREMTVLGMEVTASCEGGRKWSGRPPTPVLLAHGEHSKSENDMPEPQEIYLEGALAHESKILVADSQTKREEVYDAELNGSPEEPAVVLSSKMTLSLINLDANEQNDNDTDNDKQEIESPLADDIEIIGHDEQ